MIDMCQGFLIIGVGAHVNGSFIFSFVVRSSYRLSHVTCLRVTAFHLASLSFLIRYRWRDTRFGLLVIHVIIDIYNRFCFCRVICSSRPVGCHALLSSCLRASHRQFGRQLVQSFEVIN